MSEDVIMAVVPEMEKQTKVVEDPTIARKLIKNGYSVIDIKPKKRFPRETVFVFKVVEGFMDNLEKYIEEKREYIEEKHG